MLMASSPCERRAGARTGLRHRRHRRRGTALAARLRPARASSWIGERSGGGGAGGGGGGAGEAGGTDGSACARRAVRNCVMTRDMRPLEDFSPAAFAWEQIAEMPLQHRHRFGRTMRPGDFPTLWELAGEHLALGWSVYGDAPRWASLRSQLMELSPLAKRVLDGGGEDIEYDPTVAMYDLAFEGNALGSALYRGRVAVYSDAVEPAGPGEEDDTFEALRARVFMGGASPLGLLGGPMYAKVSTEVTRIVGEGQLEADGVLWFPWRDAEGADTGAQADARGDPAARAAGDGGEGADAPYVPHPRWPPPDDDNERRRFGGRIAYLRVLGPGVIMGRLYSGYEGEFDAAGGAGGALRGGRRAADADDDDGPASDEAAYDATQKDILPMHLSLERHFVLCRNFLSDVPAR